MKCAKNPFEGKSFDCQRSKYVALFRMAFLSSFPKPGKGHRRIRRAGLAPLSQNEEGEIVGERD